MSSSGLPATSAFTVWTGCIPKEGCRALGLKIALSVASPQVADLTPEQNAGNFAYCQALYVDNSGNTAPVTITVDKTQQVIVVQAQKQMYVPVLAPNPPKFTFASAGGVDIPVFFLNFFMPPLEF